MSHEVAVMADGRSMMAYAGQTPWHGLGQELEHGASIDVWAEASGLDITLGEGPVYAETAHGYKELEGKKIIVREDTYEPLAVVGSKYKVVQPIEVLDFFKRYVGESAQIETAGMLFGGRQYWAMARLDGEMNIAGDIVHPFLLLNTSCDGKMSTQARLTSVRVVCNNTLSAASRDSVAAKIRHNQDFCGEELAIEMGEHYESLKAHEEMLKILASVKVSQAKADIFIKRLFDRCTETNLDEVKLSRGGQVVAELFQGDGLGMGMDATKGTAYGLVQSVTQYYDHHYGRTQDRRLSKAWFGSHANKKQQFAENLIKVAA